MGDGVFAAERIEKKRTVKVGCSRNSPDFCFCFSIPQDPSRVLCGRDAR